MDDSEVTPASFLVDLLNARSPSGAEMEAQTVVDKYIAEAVEVYEKDVMGNRFATVNREGRPVLMLAGHMDEIGLIVKYVDEKGFLYFDTIGGHDRTVISGRRVEVLNENGTISGITGKRAVHLMNPEDRKKVPEIHEMWIDIGAESREEALQRIQIGDVATYDQSFQVIYRNVAVARAFDDKAGAYTICETVKRLAGVAELRARVTAVATTQEEIGVRGATTATYRVNPDFAIAVDVGHATDHPDCDRRKFGDFKLGAGPIICRGPNINPVLYRRLISCAEKEKISFQLEADPRPTGTDARAIQIGRKGVATGLISIPLRYMHTPSEIADLRDIENTVRLLCAFAVSLETGDNGVW